MEVVSIPIKYACLVRMQIEPDKAEEELKNIPDPVYWKVMWKANFYVQFLLQILW